MKFCHLALLSWGPPEIRGSQGAEATPCFALCSPRCTVGLQQSQSLGHQPRRISDLLASTPWGTPSSGTMWGLGSPTLQVCHLTPPSSSGEMGAVGSKGMMPEAAGRWAVCFPFSCGCVMSPQVGTAGHTFGGNGTFTCASQHREFYPLSMPFP